MMKARIAASMGLVLATAGGCFNFREAPSLTSTDPSLKVPAIKQAVSDNDRAAIGPLVDSLDSDDAAVRFYAIEGLRKLTGEDFGYKFYEDDDQRRPAVEKWKQWYESQSDSPKMAEASG